jgi:hypothetical protein
MKKRTAIAALNVALSLTTSGVGRAQPKEHLGQEPSREVVAQDPSGAIAAREARASGGYLIT